MSTAVKFGRGQPIHPSAEERVVLHNVGWSTYEQLLGDLANQSVPRLTYDNGVLEIMSPGPLHETITDILETLVKRFCEDAKTNIRCLRSTTFASKAVQRGFEPDSCFYIRNEALVRDRESLDMRLDPPPDLVIEVDITGSSVDKLSILAKMEVPELWVHDGRRLVIYHLRGNSYCESVNSLSFPSITSIRVSEFVASSRSLPSTEFLEALREWIRATNC